MTTTVPPTTAVAPAAAPPRPARARSRPRHLGAVLTLLAPFVLLFLAFYVVPIGFALVKSFYTVRRTGAFGPAQEVFGGFVQYAAVFGNPAFWASISRVLVFFVVSVPIQLLLALVFALLLDSPVVRGKRFFRLAYFVPYAVPGVVAAIMWGFLYAPQLSPFGAVLSSVDVLSPGLIVFAIANIVNWVFIGYNMLIVHAALQAIPAELEEAAVIDGAGQWRIAWSIKIPMVRPALTLTGVFSIIGTLQLFNEPTVLRGFTSSLTSDYTPNMLTYATANVPNYNLAAAISVVLALITCVLSFTFLKIASRRAL